MNENEEDKMIRDNYKSHLNNLKNDDLEHCPPPELLLSFYQKELSKKTKRKIEDHIVQCPLCLKALEALSKTSEATLPDNWPAIEKKIDDKFYAGLKNIPPFHKRKVIVPQRNTYWNSLIERFNSIIDVLIQPKRLVYAGAIACLAIVSIYSYAYFSRDKYFSLARIQPEQPLHLRAHTSMSAFTDGLRQFEQKEYNQAIFQFNAYLQTNPDHYASLYFLGLSHLSNAEVNLLGFAYTYDNSETEKGIASLSRALQLSGDNLYYQADCYWYLGKAYLMMGNINNAKLQFFKIIQLNQPRLVRIHEAQEIIKSLN